MPTPRATVNQIVQLGVETTPGTAIPANRLVSAFTWKFQPKPATKQFTATGRKYPSASEELTEYSIGTITGEGDFNALIYPIVSCYGKGPQILPPTAPALATATTGGTILAGTYQVLITYVNGSGETIGSSSASITTTGATSTITVTAPPQAGNATGYNSYFTALGGSVFWKQNGGSPTAIGVNFVLSAPPSTSTSNPPTVNGTGATPAAHTPSTTLAFDWVFFPP